MFKINKVAKYVAATGALCLTVGTVTPAYAISKATDTVKVTIDGSQLQTDKGVSRIYTSLQSRAKAACETPGAKPLEFRRMQVECTAKLLDDFVSDINHEKLNRLHRDVIQKNS